MTRRVLAESLLGIGASALAGCNLGTRTIRYGLRLDVRTPEGVRSGSGVIEEKVRWNDGVLRGLGAGPGIARNRRGEAVVVDLGARGLPFCLLTMDGSRPDSAGEDLLRAAFPFETWSAAGWIDSGDDPYLRFLDNLNVRRPTGEVPLARLPMLVRFRDPKDPKTAERIEPEDLAPAFGQGVGIQRTTLEITTDPVTTGIERTLPWLTLPPEAVIPLLDGPLWNSEDPHYDYSTRILLSSFEEKS